MVYELKKKYRYSEEFKSKIEIFEGGLENEIKDIKEEYNLLHLDTEYFGDSWTSYWLSVGGVALIVDSEKEDIILKVLEEDKKSAISKISSTRNRLEKIIGKLNEVKNETKD